MFKELQKKLKENESFLATKKENKFYLSQFTGSGGYIFITKNNQYFLGAGKYVEQVKIQSPDFEIVNLENKIFQEELEKIISVEKIEKIIFENENILYKDYKIIKNLNVELIENEKVLWELRERKSQRELEKIQKSCEIVEKAIYNTLEKNQVMGKTERELALLLEMEAKRLGANEIDFLIVVSGERGALPHGRPSDKMIEDGDFLTIDFGTIYEGYHSDTTRTFFVGDIEKVNPKLLEIYEIVKKAQELGVSLAKVGKCVGEIDLEVRNYITSKGYGEYFVHGLGHGVGLEGHEAPTLNKSSKEILDKNMVITVEPGIYIKDIGGVRIEDTLYITEEGAVSFMKTSKELKGVK